MTRLSALLLTGMLAIAVALGGCDGEKQPESTESDNDRNTIVFEVDGPGVSYLYRHPVRGLHRANKLEDIPLPHRVAVIVTTKAEEAPSFEARRFPVADLLEARPGSEQTAVSISKKTFVRRNLAASRGHARAESVRFWSQEVTQLSPNSDRSRASDRALRLLEDMQAPHTPPPSKRQDAP